MIRIIIISILLLSISCTHKESSGESDLTFGDMVDLDKLEKVRMHNNSGTFDLTGNQVDKINLELASMTYKPDMAVKVGAIYIELTIDGEVYGVSTATHGDYMEAHSEIVSKNKSEIENAAWLYFRIGGVNFDNYKKEKQ